jgi:excisionase family DNA binding protein
MTADEVAAFLGVDRNTVYDDAGRGVIPHQRLGKRIIAMLDARRLCETEKVETRGKGVANPKAITDEDQMIFVR